MMRYKVRFTPEAEDDLLRLYEFLAAKNPAAAGRALHAIESALQLLAITPYTCRRAGPPSPALRELLIPFGAAGYVALFEIETSTVTVLAVRHQREDDYF